MAKRFQFSFRRSKGGEIIGPGLGPDGEVGSGSWGEFNPHPGGRFPDAEKEELSIYLTSPLLGPDTIELKCMESPDDTNGSPSWASDQIPWRGDDELLDYCGLGDLSSTEQKNLTVRYGVSSIEITTGGEPVPANKIDGGGTPGYTQIDSSATTFGNVWVIHATYFNNNSDGNFHLVLGAYEMAPEADPRPGNEVLFGTYRMIKYYWELCDLVDFDEPSGMWQPGGSYDPGMTETATSYVISPTDPKATNK